MKGESENKGRVKEWKRVRGETQGGDRYDRLIEVRGGKGILRARSVGEGKAFGETRGGKWRVRVRGGGEGRRKGGLSGHNILTLL